MRLLHPQVMLDADGDGLVTPVDLCSAARRLCMWGGPALLPKDRPDLGDVLLAIACRVGAATAWRAQVRGGRGGGCFWIERRVTARSLRPGAFASFMKYDARGARDVCVGPRAAVAACACADEHSERE